jgi:predicted kinase
MALKKKIVFVAAPPASGKTYVCERLAEAMGRAVYLDKDDLSDLLRAAFRASGNEVDMDGEFYVNNLRASEYSTLLNIAFSVLRFEDTVIVGAPFGKEVRDTEYMRALISPSEIARHRA